MSMLGNRVRAGRGSPAPDRRRHLLADLARPAARRRAARHLRPLDRRPRPLRGDRHRARPPPCPASSPWSPPPTSTSPPLPPPVPMLNPAMVRPFLATDRVRFVGEPVAVVVAERPEQGVDAAEPVWVDYEPAAGGRRPRAGRCRRRRRSSPTPAPTSPSSSTSGATTTSSTAARSSSATGSSTSGSPPCRSRARSAAAAWVADGRLTCGLLDAERPRRPRRPRRPATGSTPDAGPGRRPRRRRRLRCQDRRSPEELLLPWLARQVGRPVRWTETRIGEHGRAWATGGPRCRTSRSAAARDGTIAGLPAVDPPGRRRLPGARRASCRYLTRSMAPGTYAIPKVECDATSVVTNTTPTVAYRGAGRPEATAAIERAIDLFAAEIGMDPAEVRRRNLIAPVRRARTRRRSAPPTTAATTRKALDARPRGRRLRRPAGRAGAPARGGRRGRARHRRVDLRRGHRRARRPATSTAAVEVARRRRRRRCTPARRRTGRATTPPSSMIASDELGIPMERIRVVHGDTDLVPKGVGHVRVALAAARRRRGAAGRRRGRRAGPQGRRRAARGEPRRRRARHDDGAFHVAGTPAVDRSWAEVAAAADGDGGLAADADFAAASRRSRSAPTWPSSRSTPRPARSGSSGMVAVDDAGRILNPLLADGQRHGGIAQGVGPGAVRGDPLRRRRQPADGEPRRLRHGVGGRAAELRARRDGDADAGQPARRQGHRRVGHDRLDPGGADGGVRRPRPPRRPPRRHPVHPRAGLAGDPVRRGLTRLEPFFGR